MLALVKPMMLLVCVVGCVLSVNLLACETGVYRLRHFGDFKHILGGTSPFSGASRSFKIVGSPDPSGPGQDPDGPHGRRRWPLSDWELFVRERGYLIPLALFAMFLVISAGYRMHVSREISRGPSSAALLGGR